MKVLVTGATGFIGNHVIRELLSRKHEVIATSSAYQTALEQNWYPQVKYIEHSIQLNEKDNLFDKFNNPDAVIHLAWSGLPNYTSLIHLEENLMSHYYFIKNLIQHGSKNISVTGTCFEYGLKEGSLIEEMETNPVNAYGLAKDCLRKMCEQLALHSDFNLTWMRLFYTYGKGQYRHSLIPLLESAIENQLPFFNMSKGDQVRDFMKIELMASHIVTLSTNQKNNGIVNICSGKGITVLDFVKSYLQSINKSIQLNPGYFPYSNQEPMSFWGNNSKLNKILNENQP